MLNEFITFTQSASLGGLGQLLPSDNRTRWQDLRIYKNTRTDWHLVPISHIVVNPPPFKSSYNSLPGQMGEQDLSDVDGLMYDNRRGKWTFKFVPREGETAYDINALIHDLVNFLHGNYLKIYINEDYNFADYFYMGRITVDEIRSQESGDYITLGYVLEPYKYDNNTYTSMNWALTPSERTYTQSIKITRMPSAPFIEVWDDTNYTQDTTLHIDNPKVTLSMGQVLHDGYELCRGRRVYHYTVDGRLYTPEITLDLTPYERKVYDSGGNVLQVLDPMIKVIDTSDLLFWTTFKGIDPWDYAYNHPDNTGAQIRLTFSIDSTSTGSLYVRSRYIGGWL